MLPRQSEVPLPGPQEGFISFDEEGRNNDLLYFPPTWTFQRHRDVRSRPPPRWRQERAD